RIFWASGGLFLHRPARRSIKRTNHRWMITALPESGPRGCFPYLLVKSAVAYRGRSITVFQPMLGPLNMRPTALGLAFACLLTYDAFVNSADATVVSFTNSAGFNAAVVGGTVIVEQYATGTNGQTIANGGNFDGLTYNFAAGPLGTLAGGIITNEFNSFSGLSAAGNQSTGQHFFFGGDQVTVVFPAPITDAGGARPAYRDVWAGRNRRGPREGSSRLGPRRRWHSRTG